MDWDAIKNKIGGVAPVIATMFGGPMAGAVTKMIANTLGVEATPDAIGAELERNPEALLKIKQLELDRFKVQVDLEKTGIEADSKTITEVNATMREESKSENWWTSAWRPYWGFVSATAFLALVIFVCYLAYRAITLKDSDAMTMIPQMIFAFTGLFAIPGGILGVTAWHRGKKQRGK